VVNAWSQAEHWRMETKHRVGLRVRAIRKARHMTQEQLAELIERSVDTVSLLERGKTLPSFETLERLSERLDVPLKEFVDFGGESDPERVRLQFELAEYVKSLDTEALAVAVRQIGDLTKISRRG
jgi:transcriptional regulator with XRE-family HTH domain